MRRSEDPNDEWTRHLVFGPGRLQISQIGISMMRTEHHHRYASDSRAELIDERWNHLRCNVSCSLQPARTLHSVHCLSIYNDLSRSSRAASPAPASPAPASHSISHASLAQRLPRPPRAASPVPAARSVSRACRVLRLQRPPRAASPALESEYRLFFRSITTLGHLDSLDTIERLRMRWRLTGKTTSIP